MSSTSPRAAGPERRFGFTTQRLERFPAPSSGRVWLTDAQCPDLRLQLTENGARTFYVYRWHNGRPVRVLIGSFPAIGIDGARKRAREIAGQMVAGIDPREAKREARAALTFGDLAKLYLEMHARPRKKTWREDERQLDMYLKEWRARPLTAIKREHVAALHAKLGKENGKYIANRVLALLSTVFGFAERERGWRGENPCKGLRRFTEAKRDRFLKPDEMPKFLEAVAAEPNDLIRDYLHVSLFTGARKSNVLAMKWEDLDLDGAVWRIPDTKSGQPVVLPLVDTVLDILKARPRTSDYVFPSRVGYGHLKDPRHAWRGILSRAGLNDFRLHDLRRTFGSWQAAAGTSLPIIGKSLGHSSTSATAIYSRLHLEPVRQAITTATDAMLAAGKAVGK